MKVVLKSLEYESKEPSSRLNLPDNVVLRILRTLPHRCEVHLARTCRQLNRLVWVARTSQLCSALNEFHQERTKLVDKTRDGDTLLSYSLKHGDQRMACLAAALGACLYHKTFPLHLAVEHSRVQFLSFVIHTKFCHKLDGYRNSRRQTPFELAVDEERIDCFIPLLNGGSYVNVHHGKRETAIFKAIRAKRIELVRFLINKGASLESPRKWRSGETPLFTAIRFSNMEMVKLLVENGANVNAKTSGGDFPLHRAAILNKFKIAKLLYDHGAKLGLTDHFGRTPLDWVPELIDHL